MSKRLFISLLVLLSPVLTALAQDKITIPDPERKDGAGLQAGAKLNVFLEEKNSPPASPTGEGPARISDQSTEFGAANFGRDASLKDYVRQGIVVSRWNGYLQITEAGTYYFTFGLNTPRDTCAGGVLLEGEVLFEKIPGHKNSPAGQAVDLKPGFYKIAVWLRPPWAQVLSFYGRSAVDLRMRKPGSDSVQTLSPAKLLREK